MQIIRQFTKNVRRDGKYVTEVWKQLCPCDDASVCGELAECGAACRMSWEVETQELRVTRCPESADPTLVFDYNAVPPQDYSDVLHMIDLLLQ